VKEGIAIINMVVDKGCSENLGGIKTKAIANLMELADG